MKSEVVNNESEAAGWFDDWVLPGPNSPAVTVTDGVARFVHDELFTESFGFQWNEFDVRQKEEDEKTFVAKTGVELKDLTGLRVLDAGCGGGRYVRVAAEHGARVLGVDRSLAVNKARELTRDFPNVSLAQADLSELPVPPESFDLVYSIGVLHHGPDPLRMFRSIAQAARPGGRLSVWMYRKNTWLQEAINNALRRRTVAMPKEQLLKFCRLGAWMGGVPLVNRTLNKVVSFSAHPRWENRVCDTFDWYAPRHQSHHEAHEVRNWFLDAGFHEIRELPPEKVGKLYRALVQWGWVVGSGVNLTGVKRK